MNGIGDVMAVIFETLGIAAFVKYLASRRGRKCRCPIRREMLNIRFVGLWVWLWDWRYLFWCPCDQAS